MGRRYLIRVELVKKGEESWIDKMTDETGRRLGVIFSCGWGGGNTKGGGTSRKKGGRSAQMRGRRMGHCGFH